MDLGRGDIAELSLFAKLGARDAEAWARSQIEERIPQLQRFLFLGQAWRNVLEEGNASWVERHIEEFERYPEGLYAGLVLP
jgi:hypothetical protein